MRMALIIIILTSEKSTKALGMAGIWEHIFFSRFGVISIELYRSNIGHLITFWLYLIGFQIIRTSLISLSAVWVINVWPEQVVVVQPVDRPPDVIEQRLLFLLRIDNSTIWDWLNNSKYQLFLIINYCPNYRLRDIQYHISFSPNFLAILNHAVNPPHITVDDHETNVSITTQM